MGRDQPDPGLGAESCCTLWGRADSSRTVPAKCLSWSPAHQPLAHQLQTLSPGRRIASVLSYHEPPQHQHRSLSPHRQYFDFWNSSYLARDSKYIPDNFLSSFLIISFGLKLVFENMYWDDRLFITADGQYSSHLCPTPHNTLTLLRAALHQFEQHLIHYKPITACACSPQQCHGPFVTWVPAGSSGPTWQSHCHSLGHGRGWNGPVQAQLHCPPPWKPPEGGRWKSRSKKPFSVQDLFAHWAQHG